MCSRPSTKTPHHFSLRGIAAVPGIALGTAVVVYPLTELTAIPSRTSEDPLAERDLAETAFAAVKQDLHRARATLLPRVSHDELALFDVYIQMLDETNLAGEVFALIAKGEWAAGALSQVILAHMTTFAAMSDPYLRERATDLYDLGIRVLSYLLPKQQQALDYPEATILVGSSLAATQLAEVPPGRLVGIIATKGSRNSHIAILARAMGVPAILGVNDLSLGEIDGQYVAMDAYAGHAIIAPNSEDLRTYKQLQQQEQALAADFQTLRSLPAQTLDGAAIDLYINAGLVIDANLPLSIGAAGVGLFRSEVLYTTRHQFPTMAEQCETYTEILKAFSPQPVTIRLVDIGSDKPLAYFPVTETNPALGWRGVRLLLGHPSILKTQLEALLRASVGYSNLSILVPMVTDVWELAVIHSYIDELIEDLAQQGIVVAKPPLGMMLEVPGTVELIPAFATQADFFSVGSNDLTQYVLAVDRDNAQVASYYEGLHPAMLFLLRRMVTLAHMASRPISLCGELASDPLAAVLLLAMGFDSLSLNASSLLRIKYVLRHIHVSDAKHMLNKVLTCMDAAQVRYHLEQWLSELGLARLLGKYS